MFLVILASAIATLLRALLRSGGPPGARPRRDETPESGS
jgi:hypothetical protein